MMAPILPWHDQIWQQVLQRWQQDRLPHALLLCGPQGMGKAFFAQRLAEALLCEQPLANGQACGNCKPCHLRNAATHPDLLQIQPADVGKQIPVDTIRDLIQFCNLTANYSHYQVVIIKPAEAMNRNAANSLLKLLEEPPANTLLMLVSHQPMALVATIRSRCQRLDFSRPDHTVVQTWLQSKISPDLNAQLLLDLTAQAPLAAVALVETDSLTKRHELFASLTKLPTGQSDPIAIAGTWSKLDSTPVILQWMLSWTMDSIRYVSTGQTQHVINRDHLDLLLRFTSQLNLPKLFELLDLQREAYSLITGSTNVNPQGLLESIAIAWVKLGTH